ncbi:MAG: hypothetical protein FJ297_07030 [Planctomycetes bacterium]|nr:hypothetical protein [Planctomycetota bacterium]
MPRFSRRTFLEASASAAVAAATTASAAQPARATNAASAPKAPWFEKAYRRAVIDMHIPDWDDKFLSQFDPAEYAERLVQSRAQSIVCYCQSHVGLFNFPTKVGKQHAGLRGRNVLGEMIERCRGRGIAVVLYTSLIYDRWAGDGHPEWRMRTWEGKIHGEGGRHAVLCPNSPYREYVRSFVSEICDSFAFDGIRFDMTFWPGLCYCEHCAKRYADEVGGELPVTIDWFDTKWVAFQRCRERWLVEFAELATNVVRAKRPAASVEHQSSTYPLHWMFGVTGPLARQNDFLQGDFYGDPLQGSFVRKLLEDLTPRKPFGYETSFSVALRDHTAMKGESLLEAKASAAIADNAAFIFIDAIDPIGTVNPRAHARMGTVFDRLMPYYEHLGGERISDVGVYYSLESKLDLATNGRPASSPDTSDSHTDCAMQAASRLIGGHFPFRVVTRTSLAALDGLRALVLPNVNMMDEDECGAMRRFVERGGSLYASGTTSVVDTSGRLRSDFALADVFGVHLLEANWGARTRYLRPTDSGKPFFAEFDERYPAFCTAPGFRIRAAEGADALAMTTLPWPAPDPSRFASIHSDPPWVATDEPEIVRNRFGKGVCVYAATTLERQEILRDVFLALLRDLCPNRRVEISAPSCVEGTLFHQPDRKRYVLSLVNFQKDLPNIPIDGIEARVRLGETITAVTSIPDGRILRMARKSDETVFGLPRLGTLAVYALEYR